jgi:hypothetical protein
MPKFTWQVGDQITNDGWDFSVPVRHSRHVVRFEKGIGDEAML